MHRVASGSATLLLRQTDRRVDDDLVIRKAKLIALVDRRADVHIPDRSAISQDVTHPLLGRENGGNRT